MDFRFCPRCATALVEKTAGGKPRPSCPKDGCTFVHWGNPTPVVAAIIEHEGAVLLARGKGWPEKLFALVTGFLEANETPEAAVLSVADSGTGLPVAMRQRLLAPVGPTEAHRGTGLGLTMVAKVAQVHDAQVSVGDAGGTRIEISFPLAEAAAD